MNILCKLGIHKYDEYEVHYGKDYKETREASVIANCCRKECDKSKSIYYRKVTLFFENPN